MREHITPTDLIQRLLPRPRALAAWRAHAAWRAGVLSLACLPLLLVVGAAPAAAFSFARLGSRRAEAPNPSLWATSTGTASRTW